PAGETGGGSGQNRGDFALGPTFEQVDSEPAAYRRSRALHAGHVRPAQPSLRLRHRRREFDEEVVGGLLRRAVDQALAELGELAADLRLHVIGEQRAAVFVAERHLGAAFGEAGDAAFPFARDAIAVRRIEIGETDLALPARLDRPDFDRGDGLKLVLGHFLELFAARDTAVENLGVVVLGPYKPATPGQLNVPIPVRRLPPSPPCVA